MNIKDIIAKLFGTSTQTTVSLTTEKAKTTAEIDYAYPTKTNVKLARDLYYNKNKNYTLAAQLVKPIINNNVNFVGIPTLKGNKKAIQVIEAVDIDYRKIHKAIENDGSVFIWPRWDDEEQKIVLWQVPLDVVDDIFIDPITKKITGYRFKEKVTYNTAKATNQQASIEHVITEDKIVQRVQGSINKTRTFKNVFGKIPIVHFSNDKLDCELYGHPEIENIMPQLKFYHELTYEAGAAQSRDGHPKMKVTTKNPKQWIDNNFGAGAYENIKEGKSSISMDDRDLFLNAEGDDVAYVYLNKITGEYNKLAEICFTNIVEGSETPEINFGANIGTSLASVKEFRPIWVKKIEAKQYERTSGWLEVYSFILDIYNFVNFKAIKNDLKLSWPKPDFTSVKEKAEITKGFANAIASLRQDSALTDEEIFNTLSSLEIFAMMETYKAHQEVINNEAEQKAKKIDDSSRETTDKEPEEDDEDNTKDVA